MYASATRVRAYARKRYYVHKAYARKRYYVHKAYARKGVQPQGLTLARYYARKVLRTQGD